MQASSENAIEEGEIILHTSTQVDDESHRPAARPALVKGASSRRIGWSPKRLHRSSVEFNNAPSEVITSCPEDVEATEGTDIEPRHPSSTRRTSQVGELGRRGDNTEAAAVSFDASADAPRRASSRRASAAAVTAIKRASVVIADRKLDRDVEMAAMPTATTAEAAARKNKRRSSVFETQKKRGSIFNRLAKGVFEKIGESEELGLLLIARADQVTRLLWCGMLQKTGPNTFSPWLLRITLLTSTALEYYHAPYLDAFVGSAQGSRITFADFSSQYGEQGDLLLRGGNISGAAVMAVKAAHEECSQLRDLQDRLRLYCGGGYEQIRDILVRKGYTMKVQHL